MKYIRRLFVQIFHVSRFHFITALIISCVVKIAELAPPWLLSKIIDFYSSSEISHVYDHLIWYVVVAILLTLFYPLQKVYLAALVEKTREVLAVRWSEQILRKDITQLQKVHPGKYIESFNRASNEFGFTAWSLLGNFMPDIINIFIVGFFVVLMDGFWIFPVVLLSSLLMALIAKKSLKIIEPVIARDYKWIDVCGAHFLNLLSAARSIKLMGAHRSASKGYQEATSKSHRCSLDHDFYLTSFEAINSFVIWLTQVSVLLLGWYLMHQPFDSISPSVGEIIGCYFYTATLTRSLKRLSDLWLEDKEWQEAVQPLEEVLSYGDRKIVSSLESLSPSGVDLVISPAALNFSHLEEDLKISWQQRISIPLGTHVALMGLSGEGKTTLAEVFAGLQNQKNVVFLGGKDLSQYSLSDLSQVCFYMEAETKFLRGNFWRSNFLQEDLQKNKAMTLLEELELSSLASYLDEDALIFPFHRLSQGEKKRLGLFRAMMFSRPFTILDAPTESFNACLKEKVWQLIFREFSGKTLMVVTHDRLAREKFSVILSLKSGELTTNRRGVL